MCDRAAYWAGFFDGEGSVTIRLDPGRGRGISTFSCQLVVVNTHRGVLDAIEEEFGGRIYPRTQAKAHHLPSYQWVISGKKAERFAHEILPHTTVKSNQLELFLQARLLMRPPSNVGGRRAITADELAARRAIADRNRELKRVAS